MVVNRGEKRKKKNRVGPTNFISFQIEEKMKKKMLCMNEISD